MNFAAAAFVRRPGINFIPLIDVLLVVLIFDGIDNPASSPN